MTRFVKRRVWLICCTTIALALPAAIVWRSFIGPSAVFKRYVCKPIPKSVKHVRSDRPWELSGHRYVMHFKISRDDLSCILGSRRFKQVSRVECDDGHLRWYSDTSHVFLGSLPLYSNARSVPEWFRPNDWKDPGVYWFKEMTTSYRKHMQILIYNEELGEAYLVEYQAGY